MSKSRRRKLEKRELWPLSRQLRLRKPPKRALREGSILFGRKLEK